MRRLRRFVGSGMLRGSSLVEAVVAAIVLMIVFGTTLELLPRLAMRDDEALVTIEAEYRAGRAFDKYASGLWPEGEYAERYEWGEVAVRIGPYGEREEVQTIVVTARIDGSRKRIVLRQLIRKEP